MLSTDHQPTAIWKPVYDWFNDENKQDSQILITSIGIVLLALSTTYAEIIELAAGGTACEASGCARSYGSGFFLAIFILPPFVLLQYKLINWLLKESLLQSDQLQSPTQLNLLSLTPFSLSIVLYPILMSLIYQGGVQTDLLFLITCMMKIVLCGLNIITLIFAIRYFCGLNWVSAIGTAILPSCVFAGIAIYHGFNLPPYWHLLNEDQVYLTVQHYLLGLLH